MALDVGGRRDGVGRPDEPPHPPAGHGVGLGHAVGHQAAVGQLGHDDGHGVVLGPAVDEVLVDLVGQHPDALARPPIGRWPRSRRGGRRRRSGSRATRRGAPWSAASRPLELLDRGAEAGRLVRGDDDRHAAGQGDRLGVGGPERGQHQDLVARVAQHGEGVGHGLLAAVGDQHLVGRHLEARVAQGLGRDGLAQRRDPARRRVAVVGRVPAGGDGRLDDVGRRREVRLAGAEADDVLAGRLQRLGLRIDGQGGRGRHGGGPARDPAELGRRRGGRHGCHDLIRARRPRHHHSARIAALRRPFRVRPLQGPPGPSTRSPRWRRPTWAPATARRRSSHRWAGSAPACASSSRSPTATRSSSATGGRPASGTPPPSG